MFELIIVAANLIVGGCIGLCGIAGFLLPITYVGFMGMPLSEALTLSFLAFLVSGVIGSYNYYKSGNLDLKLSGIISAGSFVGALAGVRLNRIFSQSSVKMLLYLVVLLSGISILLRMRQSADSSKKEASADSFWLKPPVIICIGLVTGAICSLSGAGGPVLVMPILVCLGLPVHVAIGVSLFDSIFIALPAFAGYAMATDLKAMIVPLVLCAAAQGVGVMLGSKNAHRIKQEPLKLTVAVLSIGVALYMIFLG